MPIGVMQTAGASFEADLSSPELRIVSRNRNGFLRLLNRYLISASSISFCKSRVVGTNFNPASLARYEARSHPAFFITFFLYARHRHRIAILREFFESATSGTVPVSRDGYIFGPLFDNLSSLAGANLIRKGEPAAENPDQGKESPA